MEQIDAHTCPYIQSGQKVETTQMPIKGWRDTSLFRESWIFFFDGTTNSLSGNF